MRTCKNIHMYTYAVCSTQHWILLPVVVQEHVVINMASGGEK